MSVFILNPKVLQQLHRILRQPLIDLGDGPPNEIFSLCSSKRTVISVDFSMEKIVNAVEQTRTIGC
ncbi:hypothetical protein [Arthrobacter sp. MYb227]|uniref:hypothetical protein n=1 Tax=Arthrobacter sp. MYb227 TaxID=1848601 RepID=UPI0011AFFC2A|nr:hypothetical protein [Arthrobacter sp. MYb227]